jgi:hypothetical protein
MNINNKIDYITIEESAFCIGAFTLCLICCLLYYFEIFGIFISAGISYIIIKYLNTLVLHFRIFFSRLINKIWLWWSNE